MTKFQMFDGKCDEKVQYKSLDPNPPNPTRLWPECLRPLPGYPRKDQYSAQYGLNCHQKNTYFTTKNVMSYFRYNNLRWLELFCWMGRCVTRNKMKYWRMLSGLWMSVSLTMKFGFRNYFRQADKNGDGKISVEEIIRIFKVRMTHQYLAILLITSGE